MVEEEEEEKEEAEIARMLMDELLLQLDERQKRAILWIPRMALNGAQPTR